MKLNETEKEQLKNIKETFNQIIKYNSKNGFISYYSARKFEREFLDYLFEVSGELFGSRQISLLFETLCFLVKKIGAPIDIDDSDGNISDIMYEIMELYKRCIYLTSEEEKTEALKWFEENFNNEKIIDYIQEYILDGYFNLFTDEKSLKTKLKFIDKYLEQNDYSNDIFSMGRFEFQQFVNARVKTMELLKFPESEIIDFLEQYSNISDICFILVDYCINQKNYEKAENLLYGLIDNNQNYLGIVLEAKNKLYELYKATNNKEKLQKILRSIFLSMRTFNIEKYNEYKSYFSNDEWKTEIESLLQESSRFEFEILYEEKMYDDLYVAVEKTYNKYGGIHYIKEYAAVLLPKYSNQLAEMFVKALEKNIENLRNRDDYRCFAKDLKFLAKNLTAFEKASELREKWLVEYKRKSALCEELRLAF